MKNTYSEVLSESTDILSKLVDKLFRQINICKKAINDLESLNQSFLDIFESINDFIKIVSLTSGEIAYRNRLIKDSKNTESLNSSLRSLKVHLLSIIKAIKSSLIVEDIIALSDLLEYELKDNLIQWKIQGIPQIKKAMALKLVPNQATSNL